MAIIIYSQDAGHLGCILCHLRTSICLTSACLSSRFRGHLFLLFPPVKNLFLHSHTYLHVGLGVFVRITRMWAPPRLCSYLIHLVHPDILPLPESPSLSLKYMFTFYRHAENCWCQQQSINYWLLSGNPFLKQGGKKPGTVKQHHSLMDTAFPFPSGHLDKVQSQSVTLITISQLYMVTAARSQVLSGSYLRLTAICPPQSLKNGQLMLKGLNSPMVFREGFLKETFGLSVAASGLSSDCLALR